MVCHQWSLKSSGYRQHSPSKIPPRSVIEPGTEERRKKPLGYRWRCPAICCDDSWRCPFRAEGSKNDEVAEIALPRFTSALIRIAKRTKLTKANSRRLWVSHDSVSLLDESSSSNVASSLDDATDLESSAFVLQATKTTATIRTHKRAPNIMAINAPVSWGPQVAVVSAVETVDVDIRSCQRVSQRRWWRW
jgi:hypothetical protein